MLDALPTKKNGSVIVSSRKYVVFQGDFFIPGRGMNQLYRVYNGGIPSLTISTFSNTIRFSISQTMTRIPVGNKDRIVDFSREKFNDM